MIITIAHQKGGVGKSTISFNLAYFFRNENPNTTLIDLDIQQSLTFTNRLRDEKNQFPIIQTTSTNELKQIIQNDHDELLYIVDVGGFDSDVNRLAIAGADLLITPASAQGLEVLGLQTFEKILITLSQAMDKNICSHVLLNRINPLSKNFDDLKGFINQSEYFEALNSIVRSRIAISDSIAQGLAVAEYAPKSKASHEFFQLFQEIQKWQKN